MTKGEDQVQAVGGPEAPLLTASGLRSNGLEARGETLSALVLFCYNLPWLGNPLTRPLREGFW